jgi:hypothetical protein
VQDKLLENWNGIKPINELVDKRPCFWTRICGGFWDYRSYQEEQIGKKSIVNA